MALIAFLLGILLNAAIFNTYDYFWKYYTVRSLTGWAETVVSRRAFLLQFFVLFVFYLLSDYILRSTSWMFAFLFHCGSIN